MKKTKKKSGQAGSEEKSAPRKISYAKFTLPTFRSPLAGEGDIGFRDEIDHAFFLRCCELYRVIDLIDRTTDRLVEVYSKYRHRNQFMETLTFRYFDSEEALVAKFDPKLAANLFAVFNFIYELRINLTYTDELPLTVQKQIEDAQWTMIQTWNELTDGVEDKYGWKFKKFSRPI